MIRGASRALVIWSLVFGGILLTIWAAEADLTRPGIWRFLFGTTGFLSLVAGLVSRSQLRRLRERNGHHRRAEPPSDGLNEGDHVWLDGEIRCPEPVKAPAFGEECAWYHYREVAPKAPDPQESRGAPAWVVGPAGRVELDLERAEFDHLPVRTEGLGKLKASLAFLPASGPVSAAGIIRQSPGADGEAVFRLTGSEDLPLLVTPSDRDSWLAQADREETERTAGASLSLLLGIISLAGVGLSLVGGL